MANSSATPPPFTSNRHVADGDQHPRPIGGSVGVGVKPQRIAHFVEGEGAEFDAAFEDRLHALRVSFVFVEPGECQVGGGKFFSDDFVDEVLARLRLVLRVPLLRL
jgi:hypothetical protein